MYKREVKNPRGHIEKKDKKKKQQHKLHNLFVSEFKQHMKERDIRYLRPLGCALPCGACGFKKNRNRDHKLENQQQHMNGKDCGEDP